MRTIAENANDFASIRTMDKGNCIYVDESAEAALAQIKEKDYAAPYRARNLPIWAIGLNFDSKTRQLTGAVHERLQGSR